METQQRPRAVTISVGLMVAFTVMIWVNAYFAGRMSFTTVPILMVATLILGIILRGFWEGERWARHLVLITSLLTIFDPGHVSGSWFRGVAIAGQFLLSLFLLFWLNGVEGRTYFNAVYRDQPQAPTQSPSAS